jgi:mannose-1-phosphate guanylyltransferase
MNQEATTGQRWAIVLAAGEGTRLSALTEALHGRPVPKQFAALCGSRSFLQKTIDRIEPIIPAHRTVVVVAESQLALAHEQLAGYAGIEIVAQPGNRGTAAGVLLPLMHVLARDPEAEVVVLPSDHHVEREPAFLDAIRRAFRASELAPSRIALVGAAAEGAAVDLGWIACRASYGPAAAQARRVQRFVEKPVAAVALELLRAGALWNTLVIAADGQALLRLARRHVPEAARQLTSYRAVLGQDEAQAVLRAIYRSLPSVDLSRDMLQPARGLAAVAMVDAGWSDCGTSERLFRALRITGELSDLIARLPVDHQEVQAA